MSEKRALTESDLIERLRVRYSAASGNGVAWAFIPKVRSAAAFDARRTIDAYAMGLWPSRGLPLLAFEIKSSRSDWQRELRDPEKAEEFCELADYFYLVVGDKEIVKSGELPETWGLIVPHGKGLKVAVEAPRLRPAEEGRVKPFPPNLDRSFLAALLRAACFVGTAKPTEIRDAEQRVRESEREHYQQQLTALEGTMDNLRAERRAFEESAGVSLTSRWPEWSPADLGAALKLVLAGEHHAENVEQRLRNVRDTARRLCEYIEGVLPSPEGA